jgi:hypothetical protein
MLFESAHAKHYGKLSLPGRIVPCTSKDGAVDVDWKNVGIENDNALPVAQLSIRYCKVSAIANAKSKIRVSGYISSLPKCPPAQTTFISGAALEDLSASAGQPQQHHRFLGKIPTSRSVKRVREAMEAFYFVR